MGPESDRGGVLVSLVGVDPTSMVAPFVVQGSLWVFFLVAWLYRQGWAWHGRVAIAIATLWYIPFGKILSVIQIGIPLRYKSFGDLRLGLLGAFLFLPLFVLLPCSSQRPREGWDFCWAPEEDDYDYDSNDYPFEWIQSHKLAILPPVLEDYPVEVL